VSGLNVRFRQTTGAEDMLLTEHPSLDLSFALTLAGALGQLADGGDVPWETLSVTDLDAALLAMRQAFVGDYVRSSVICASAKARHTGAKRGTAEMTAGCPSRIDIAFRIGDYLAHHRPVVPRGLSFDTEPGWYRLDGCDATWRIASCADQLTVWGRPDAEQELARRCIRPDTVPLRTRRKVEAAMEKVAPSLFDNLDGRCPECAAPVRIAFDPQRYVLAELRERAMFIYEEVHLIAAHYRWSEREILALPWTRRARNAELVHEARVGG
jgi:hypothetical protein